MSLEVQCPGCSTRYRVADDKGGKQLRCKHCQEVISVPMASSGPDPFNVFDSVSGDELYGNSDTTQGGNRGETFDDGDLFKGLDKGPTFSNAPTIPPPARTAISPPRQSGGDNSLLIGVGLGAVVVIGLAIGAFVYFRPDINLPAGGRGGGAVAQGGGQAEGGGEVIEAGTTGGGITTSGEGETSGAGGEEMPSGETSGGETPSTGSTTTEETTVAHTDDVGTSSGGTSGDTSTGGESAGGESTGRPETALPVIREEHGTLARGDRTLPAGEYYDEYFFDGVAGQLATITFSTSDFDAYLVLETPSGDVYVNDDAGGLDLSAIRLPLPESGTYGIYATSLKERETGAYDLQIRLSVGTTFVEQGELRVGDSTGYSGAYQDTYTIQGVRGQRLTVMVRSNEFDTLLQVHAPDGSVFENDDACYAVLDDLYSGTPATDSLLTTGFPANGEYQIVVTSYDPAKTGSYTLAYDLAEPADRVEVGNLGVRDERLSETFEYYDRYTLQGRSGQQVRITLSSPDFNPYIILVSPNGDHFESDNFYPGSLTAEVMMPLPESGEYLINATSSEARETGDYVLTIDFE